MIQSIQLPNSLKYINKEIRTNIRDINIEPESPGTLTEGLNSLHNTTNNKFRDSFRL